MVSFYLYPFEIKIKMCKFTIEFQIFFAKVHCDTAEFKMV